MGKHNDSNSLKKASEDLMKASDYDTNNVSELLHDQIITAAAKNRKVLRKIIGKYSFSFKALFTVSWKLVIWFEKWRRIQLSPASDVKKFRWSRWLNSGSKIVNLSWNSKQNLRNYESVSSPWNSTKYKKLSYMYNNGR